MKDDDSPRSVTPARCREASLLDVVQRRCGLQLHSDLVFDIDGQSATSSIGILPPLAGAIKMRGALPRRWLHLHCVARRSPASRDRRDNIPDRKRVAS